MRFNNLQLVRYGHFTDHQLDFSLAKTSTPDLHIVCGRNEAGKSTISNAIIDFLFGIPTRSQYAFIHSTASLEVAANITLPTGDMTLRRLKTQLRNENNDVLDANFLDTHNLSRQDYQSRFWFDDVTLHEGGESILNNKGDLGAALFAATTGLNTLSEQLNTLMLPTDAFFKPGKRTKIEVKALRDSLKEIQKELKSLDNNRTNWNRLTKLHKNQSDTVQVKKNELQLKRAEINKLQALRNALKQYQTWKFNQRTLESKTEVEKIPETWIEDFLNLRQEHHGLVKTIQLLNSDIQSLNTSMTAEPVDSAWEAHKATLEELTRNSELFKQEKSRLGELQEQIERCDISLNTITSNLSAFPLANITDHNLLTADNIERMDASIEQWKTDTNLVKHLTLEHSALENRQSEHSQLNQGATAMNADFQNTLDRLQLAVNAGSFPELIESHKQQRQRLGELEQDANEVFITVTSIGINEQEDLHKLNAISAEAAREANEVRRNAALHITTEKNKTNQLQASITKLDKQLSQLGHSNTQDALPYLQANAALRRSWAQLQTLLDTQADSDKLHAQMMRVEADLAILEESIQRHFEAAENMGKINSLLQTHQETSNEVIALMESTAAAEQQFEALISQQNDLVKHLPNLSLDDSNAYIAWRESLEQWRTADRKRLAQQTKVDTINSVCEAEQSSLLALVTSLNPNGSGSVESSNTPTSTLSFSETLALAKNTLKYAEEKWQKHQLSINKAKESEHELKRIVSRIQESEQQLKLAAEAIKTELTGTWLQECSVDAVASHWPTIKRHTTQLNEKTALNNQFTTTNNTVNRITKQVTEFITTLSLGNSTNTLENLSRLIEFHHQQVKRHTEHSQHTKTLREQSVKLKTASTELSHVDKTLQPMHDALNTSKLDELNTALNLVKSIHQLRRDQNQLELSICDNLATDTFLQARVDLDKAMQAMEANAEASVGSTDSNGAIEENAEALHRTQIIRSQMDQNIDTLIIEEASCEQALTDAQKFLHDTERELEHIGLDERVAELRQKEADLTHEIEEGVLQAMKMRLGLRAIERGLQHFRDKNRSGMLAEAKRSFATLTQDNYIDLVTRPNDKGVEHLFATRMNGKSVGAEQLSVGTRYQLYLALRIAAFHEYRQHRAPLPFIADDIFETFDEPRTKSALSELSDMAMHGQVIYFTHHQHVADIAREVVPHVNTITLP